MTTFSIYPHPRCELTTANGTSHAAIFNLMADCGLADANPYSIEHYLADHATEQTIERVLELKMRINILIYSTDMFDYAAYLVLVQSSGATNIPSQLEGGDPTGPIDTLANCLSDPWAADILCSSPCQYFVTNGGNQYHRATLSASYQVPKGQYDNGGFTSWPAVGELMCTEIFLIVHATNHFANATHIGYTGVVEMRKSTVFNNNTLMGGVY